MFRYDTVLFLTQYEFQKAFLVRVIYWPNNQNCYLDFSHDVTLLIFNMMRSSGSLSFPIGQVKRKERQFKYCGTCYASRYSTIGMIMGCIKCNRIKKSQSAKENIEAAQNKYEVLSSRLKSKLKTNT